MVVQHAANLFISKIITHIMCLPSTNPADSKMYPHASPAGSVMAPWSVRICCITQWKGYQCLQFNCNMSFQGNAYMSLDRCQTYSSPEKKAKSQLMPLLFQIPLTSYAINMRHTSELIGPQILGTSPISSTLQQSLLPSF